MSSPMCPAWRRRVHVPSLSPKPQIQFPVCAHKIIIQVKNELKRGQGVEYQISLASPHMLIHPNMPVTLTNTIVVMMPAPARSAVVAGFMA